MLSCVCKLISHKILPIAILYDTIKCLQKKHQPQAHGLKPVLAVDRQGLEPWTP